MFPTSISIPEERTLVLPVFNFTYTLTFLQHCRQPQLPQLRLHAVRELCQRSRGKGDLLQGSEPCVGVVLAGELPKPLLHFFLGLVGEQQTNITTQSLQTIYQDIW